VDAGICQPGDSNASCGGVGGICSQCGVQNYCDGGACLPNQCGGGCSGCCDQGTSCIDAGQVDDSHCGLGGVSCAICGANEYCQIFKPALARCTPIDAGTPDSGPEAGDGGSTVFSGLRIANLGCNCSSSGAAMGAALAAFALRGRRRR
jgi:uncharacterized protein (TIGR03382 family)